MSTATRKLDDGAKVRSWSVRNEQGETFGPVDFDTLKSWAGDGRLAPTNEVSENGTSWVLATALRALGMDWVAEVTPGTFYGPIHRRAMDELIRDGSISVQCSFFRRCGLDAGAEEAARAASEAESLRLAQQQVAADAEELKRVRAAAASAEERLAETERQVAELTEEARRQAAAFEEQLRSARELSAASSAEAKLAQERSVAAEASLNRAEQALGDRAEQSRRQVAAYEEQIRGLQQQAFAQAAQLERAQARTVALEQRLDDAECKAASRDAEVARLCEELASAASRAAELSAEPGVGALEEQVRSLGAEVAGLRQALSGEKELAQQAQVRCASLETALAEARTRCDKQEELGGLRDELRHVRLQIEDLCGKVAAIRVQTDASVPPATDGRPVRRVEAEPVEVEVLPPERAPRASRKVDPPTVRTEKASGGEPNGSVRSATGLSLAELEMQARRELERLGAQGAKLFRKK